MKMQRAYAGSALAIALLIGCRSEEMPAPRLAMEVGAVCPGGTDTYFPPGKVMPHQSGEGSRNYRLRMAQYFRAAGLPELWCGDAPDAYRMAWVHSFRAAVVVEVRQSGRQWEAVATQFNDPREKVSYEPIHLDGVAARYRRYLTADEVRDLHVDMMFLWRLAPDDINAMADDGYSLTLEGRRSQGYRVITRISAEEPAADDAARQLIRLAGMSIPFMMESRKGQGGIQNTSPWGGVSGWTAWLYAGEVTTEGRHWVTPPKLIVRFRNGSATYRVPMQGDRLEITAPLELRQDRRLEPDNVIGHLRDTDSVEVLEVVQVDASPDSKGVWARVRAVR